MRNFKAGSDGELYRKTITAAVAQAVNAGDVSRGDVPRRGRRPGIWSSDFAPRVPKKIRALCRGHGAPGASLFSDRVSDRPELSRCQKAANQCARDSGPWPAETADDGGNQGRVRAILDYGNARARRVVRVRYAIRRGGSVAEYGGRAVDAIKRQHQCRQRTEPGKRQRDVAVVTAGRRRPGGID